MKYYILTFLLLAAAGCNTASKPVQTTDNTAAAKSSNSEKSQTAIAHSLEKQTPPADSAPSGGKSKWTQGGEPIDTKELDTTISSAEAAVKSKPNDEAAKKALSSAYFMRAEALKDARQYASALGDYRRALKNDPSNTKAKDWIDQIIMIYDSMGRESPPEGQEPPPLTKKG
jgi:tetratricopeptide (TPR) repeat protein